MSAITRQTTKVTITPVDHFTGARHTRRTWAALLAPREGEGDTALCPHTHGHKTVDAAKACGVAMWKKLPA